MILLWFVVYTVIKAIFVMQTMSQIGYHLCGFAHTFRGGYELPDLLLKRYFARDGDENSSFGNVLVIFYDIFLGFWSLRSKERGGELVRGYRK